MIKKSATLLSLAGTQNKSLRFSLLCASILGLSVPLATGWAATWPTPVLINSTVGLQQAVTGLNQAIIAYTNDPSPTNLAALTAAQAHYQTQVGNANPNAVLAVNSNDSILPPTRLVINTPRAASIQASNGAVLTIENFANPAGGAIALSNGAALDISAEDGAQIVFRNNSGTNGGAINNNNSTLSITGARFENNSAPPATVERLLMATTVS